MSKYLNGLVVLSAIAVVGAAVVEQPTYAEVGTTPKTITGAVVNTTTGAAVNIDQSDFEFDENTGTIRKYNGSETEVVIPSEISGVSVTSIGNGAFYKCNSVTSIDIPNSVTNIGVEAFSSCSNLTSITIPNGVKFIGIGAFVGCSNLTSITIPDSVTAVAGNAFLGCSNLKNIIVDNNNENYTSVDGVLFDKLKTKIIKYPEGKENKSYTIPNSVTNIGDLAFHKFNDSALIYSKGFGTFNNCKNLINVIIPNSVTNIGEDAFLGCSNLTSITISNSVASIGEYAFQSCSNLTSITIPDSVTSIANNAFLGCSNLKNIIVDNNNENYTSVDGVLFDKLKTKIIKYLEGKENKSYIIPNSVKSIGDGAFSYCEGLTNITIPNSVASIGDYAFSYCESLTNITIPNSVTSIEDYAFLGCSNLTSMIIPDSVTSIGKYAFIACNNLININITITDSVTVQDKDTKELLINCGVDENKIGLILILDAHGGSAEKVELKNLSDAYNTISLYLHDYEAENSITELEIKDKVVETINDSSIKVTIKDFNLEKSTTSNKGLCKFTVILTENKGNSINVDYSNTIPKQSYSSGGSSHHSSSSSTSSTGTATTGTSYASQVAQSNKEKVVTSVSTILGTGVTIGQVKQIESADGNKLSVTNINKDGKCVGAIITAEKDSSSTTIPVSTEQGEVTAVYKFVPVLNKYIKLTDAVKIEASQVSLPTQANATYYVATVPMDISQIVSEGWAKFGSNWYLVNKTGDPQTGWQKDSTGWVYLDPSSGVMQTGWNKQGDIWYYLGKNGYMSTGWVKTDENWYYLNSDGSMVHDTTVDGYTVGSNGTWIS